ncbi:diacylglycerol/lipid kinase family protein [Chloroflexota bacterium]
MDSTNKKIHVIINPSAGQNDTILNKLNTVFHAAGVNWDVSVTHESGDATHFAHTAMRAGVDVVCAYGGDGTVMEVAHAIQGGDVPMAILPGGTANLISVELGIPKDLTKAAEIAISNNSVVRLVDLGKVGDDFIMLRVGVGFEGEKVKGADRELKDRFGILAYSIAGLKALHESEIANYRLTIDGEVIEVEGFNCMVDNCGNFGVSGFTLSKDISVSDGLLDVIIVRDSRFRSAISTIKSIAGKQPDPESFHHWQARQIVIEASPSQLVHLDGEMWGETPVTVKVLSGVLPILTPGE